MIGQLAHHVVPDGKTAVAGFAGGEFAVEAPGALVAPSAGHALRTGALARGAVALLTGDTARVTVTSCKRRDDGESRDALWEIY